MQLAAGPPVAGERPLLPGALPGVAFVRLLGRVDRGRPCLRAEKTRPFSRVFGYHELFHTLTIVALAPIRGRRVLRRPRGVETQPLGNERASVERIE